MKFIDYLGGFSNVISIGVEVIKQKQKNTEDVLNLYTSLTKAVAYTKSYIKSNNGNYSPNLELSAVVTSFVYKTLPVKAKITVKSFGDLATLSTLFHR